VGEVVGKVLGEDWLPGSTKVNVGSILTGPYDPAIAALNVTVPEPALGMIIVADFVV